MELNKLKLNQLLLGHQVAALELGSCPASARVRTVAIPEPI